MTSTLATEPARDVVLVHGIFDTSWALNRLNAALTSAGFRTHPLDFGINDGRDQLEELATAVCTKVEGSVPAGARYSIVGFSMGGLIGRYYAQRLADRSRIDALVTIGTPHRGTWLAYIYGPTAANQMRPNSDFLRDLETDGESCREFRWITISTPIDLMVLPWTSCQLPWAVNHVFRVIFHPLLIFDKRVIHQVVESLSSRSPELTFDPSPAPVDGA